MVLNLYSFMELPESMRRLASQEDLKLPLTTFRPVHQETAQLGRRELMFLKLVESTRKLVSWGFGGIKYIIYLSIWI